MGLIDRYDAKKENEYEDGDSVFVIGLCTHSRFFESLFDLSGSLILCIDGQRIYCLSIKGRGYRCSGGYRKRRGAGFIYRIGYWKY